MAGIIWFGEPAGTTWVAENWLYDTFLTDANAYFSDDVDARRVLSRAMKARDLELAQLAAADAALAARLRRGLRAVADASIARGTDAEGGTKKYLDSAGQEFYLDKMREYLARDREK